MILQKTGIVCLFYNSSNMCFAGNGVGIGTIIGVVVAIIVLVVLALIAYRLWKRYKDKNTKVRYVQLSTNTYKLTRSVILFLCVFVGNEVYKTVLFKAIIYMNSPRKTLMVS